MIKRLFLPGIYKVVIVLLIFLPACSKNQSGNQDIFSRYEGEPGVYIMKVPPSLMTTLAGSDVELAENLKNAGKIDIVKVMVFNRPENGEKTVVEVNSEVKEMTGKMGYDLMMSMTGGKTDVSVLMLESGEMISDLLVIAREGQTLTVIGISGNLNTEAIVNLISQSELNSLEKGVFGFR